MTEEHYKRLVAMLIDTVDQQQAYIASLTAQIQAADLETTEAANRAGL